MIPAGLHHDDPIVQRSSHNFHKTTRQRQRANVREGCEEDCKEELSLITRRGAEFPFIDFIQSLSQIALCWFEHFLKIVTFSRVIDETGQTERKLSQAGFIRKILSYKFINDKHFATSSSFSSRPFQGVSCSLGLRRRHVNPFIEIWIR
jgi:hypothetical protein